MEKKEITFNSYKNLDQAIADLKKIKSIDLVFGETPMKEAVDFCKDVMVVIGRTKHMLTGRNLATKDIMKFSEALKSIGCVPYKRANIMYQYCSRNQDYITAKNNIVFPLTAFTQLIDSKPSTFSYGMTKLNEGDFAASWVGFWLRAQGVTDPNAYQEARHKLLEGGKDGM